MILRVNAPDWTSGKCLAFPPTREHDPFFGDGPDADMADALDLCNGTADGVVCPIRQQCLTFALINNEHYGVFGGLEVSQRHFLRRFVEEERDRVWENAPDASLLHPSGKWIEEEDDGYGVDADGST